MRFLRSASQSLPGAPLLGGVAGFIATIPMTLVMLGVHQLLPRWEQYPVPPQRITDKLLKRVRLRKDMSKEQLLGTALVSHFGYGSSMGAIYGFGPYRWMRNPLGGMAYGLVIWASGYLGWLPALDLLPPETSKPPQRSFMMVAAHLVWGGCLTLCLNALCHRGLVDGSADQSHQLTRPERVKASST